MNNRFSVLSRPFRWYPVTGDKEDPEAGLTMSSEIKGLTDEELMTGYGEVTRPVSPSSSSGTRPGSTDSLTG